jgi:HK97 family phage major capsid protein
MRLSDAMLVEGEPRNTDEQRAASLRFRETLRLGEARTYSPMTTSGQPQIIPQDFSDKMAQLMLAAGPLYFGSPVLTNIERTNLEPLKVPVSTDLNQGYFQTEAGAVTEQELGFDKVSLGKNTVSSGIILLSTELVEDISSWTSVEALIQRTAAARLSRKQNSAFLASLQTALAANSSASVAAAGSTLAYGDLTNLVAGVNAQYRYSESAGFIMNSNTAKAISNLKDSQNRPLFKKILAPEPELMDYPVYVSDYAQDIGSGNSPIVFGSLEYIYSRHVPGFELQVLRQRFIADGGYQAVILRQRGDIQYSVPSASESAIKMLTIS